MSGNFVKFECKEIDMKKRQIIKWTLFVIVILSAIFVIISINNGESMLRMLVSGIGGCSFGICFLMSLEDLVKSTELDISEDNEYPENVGGIDD